MGRALAEETRQRFRRLRVVRNIEYPLYPPPQQLKASRQPSACR